jgi:2,4-dichlorophenol 6-monooxygenase
MRDKTDIAPADRTLITHFINPEGEKMVNFDCGALVQMGPTWGRKSEEWTLHFGFPVTDNSRFDKEALPPRIRQLLKLPDLEMEVLHISHWVLDRVLADKYRVGRVFIAGDAAHRRPPTTGLGLNTSIEDALNISWKLAAVLHKKADVSLLETYEAERRPVGLRNCDWALFAFSNMSVLQAAVGLVPGAKEQNDERFRRIFEDSAFGRIALGHIQRIISSQQIEFEAHDIELGFVYETGAVISDGSRPPPVDPSGGTYIPTTRPGHRLPHAWVEEKKGVVVSTHDLLVVGTHDFFLITDEDGDAWITAANHISKTTKLSVGTAKIRTRGHSKGNDLYYDYQEQWGKLRDIGNGGAILIRPDNFVAWRSYGPSDEASAILADVVAKLLTREPAAASTATMLNGPNGVNGH